MATSSPFLPFLTIVRSLALAGLVIYASLLIAMLIVLADEATPHTFNLIFSGSDRFPARCAEVSTKVEFVCDRAEGRGRPKITSTSDNRRHHVDLSSEDLVT